MKNPFSLINLIFLSVIYIFWFFLKTFAIITFYDPNSIQGIIFRVVLTFLSYVTYLGYIFIVLKSRGLDMRNEIKIIFLKRDLILGVLAGFTILLVAILLIYYFDFNIVAVNSSRIGLIISNPNVLLVTIFGVYMMLFAPFIEEILFRGYMWRILEDKKINEVIILIITSVLFAAAHLEIKRFVLLLINGIIIGSLRMRTNRLGPSIIAHITTNVIAFISYF